MSAHDTPENPASIEEGNSEALHTDAPPSATRSLELFEASSSPRCNVPTGYPSFGSNSLSEVNGMLGESLPGRSSWQWVQATWKAQRSECRPGKGWRVDGWRERQGWRVHGFRERHGVQQGSRSCNSPNDSLEGNTQMVPLDGCLHPAATQDEDASDHESPGQHVQSDSSHSTGDSLPSRPTSDCTATAQRRPNWSRGPCTKRNVSTPRKAISIRNEHLCLRPCDAKVQCGDRGDGGPTAAHPSPADPHPAAKLLDFVDEADLCVIRTFTNPPTMVAMILANAHCLLGQPEDWRTIRCTLRSMPNFMQNLRSLDVSRVTRSQVELIRKRMKKCPAAFDPVTVFPISSACAALSQWVNVICEAAVQLQEGQLHGDAACLAALKKESLNELSRFARPPEIVEATLGNVHCLLGLGEEWSNARSSLRSSTNFLRELQYFDQASVSASILQKMRRRHHNCPSSFNPEIVISVNCTCAVLCEWVNAVCSRAGLDFVPLWRALDLHKRSSAISTDSTTQSDFSMYSLNKHAAASSSASTAEETPLKPTKAGTEGTESAPQQPQVLSFFDDLPWDASEAHQATRDWQPHLTQDPIFDHNLLLRKMLLANAVEVGRHHAGRPLCRATFSRGLSVPDIRKAQQKELSVPARLSSTGNSVATHCTVADNWSDSIGSLTETLSSDKQPVHLSQGSHEITNFIPPDSINESQALSSSSCHLRSQRRTQQPKQQKQRERTDLPMSDMISPSTLL